MHHPVSTLTSRCPTSIENKSLLKSYRSRVVDNDSILPCSLPIPSCSASTRPRCVWILPAPWSKVEPLPFSCLQHWLTCVNPYGCFRDPKISKKKKDWASNQDVITRQVIRFYLVNINDADGIDCKPLSVDLPLEIVHDKLLVSRVKSKPWCGEFTLSETWIWARIRHLRNNHNRSLAEIEEKKRDDLGQGGANSSPFWTVEWFSLAAWCRLSASLCYFAAISIIWNYPLLYGPQMNNALFHSIKSMTSLLITRFSTRAKRKYILIINFIS